MNRGKEFYKKTFRSVLLLLLFLSVPLPASVAAEGTPGNKRIFVFWNLQSFLLKPRNDEKGRQIPAKEDKKIQKAAEILAHLAPDFLGLAEVGGIEEVEELCRRMGGIGERLKHRKVLEGPDEIRRLAFLSAEPFLADSSKERIVFEIGGKISGMRRGILDVTIQKPNSQKVRFVGVHLKSRRIAQEFDPTEFRAVEARHLLQHLKSIPSNELIFLWGDFNCYRNDFPIRILDTIDVKPIRLLDKRGESWTHRWQAAGMYSQFDYFLTNPMGKKIVDEEGSFLAEEVPWQEVSDHRPYVVQLLWN